MVGKKTTRHGYDPEFLECVKGLVARGAPSDYEVACAAQTEGWDVDDLREAVATTLRMAYDLDFRAGRRELLALAALLAPGLGCASRSW